MKIAFHTLGCRLNFSETGAMVKASEDEGHSTVAFGQRADVTLINSCTVTDGADATCRATVRKARRFSPKGKIIVAGCYAQTDGKALLDMPEIDLILGTSEKHRFLRHLENNTRIDLGRGKSFHTAVSSPSQGRTRAFLKIQDGCNYRCTFCIIPRARGSSRWMAPEGAKRSIVKLVAQGFKEVVLTGVNVGEYGRRGNEDLAHLIEDILQIEGLERLRLSSVEPNTITPELLRVLRSSPKFMPHFHIPLQSGNNEILKKMKRRYRAEEYKNILNLVEETFPESCVGADMICGFPGEKEKHFEDTYRLAEQSTITHFHVFPYSSRRDTLASTMPGSVSTDIRKARVKRLMALGQEKMRRLMESQLHRPSCVLFEHRDGLGRWWGYSPHYLKVAVTSGEGLKNKILEVLPFEVEGFSLRGRLANR